LKAYCYKCHGPDKEKGDIRFDKLNPDLVEGDNSETWHDALDQLNLGDMPPSKAKQPTREQRQKLTRWILSALREASEAKRYQDGRVMTRRLTRYEYANTMRDLLLLDFDYDRELPPEPASGAGFLNNGAILEMSPTQIEMYLDMARRALDEAIIMGPRPKAHTFSQSETSTGKLPTRTFAGHSPVHPEFILNMIEFPRHGEFELKITAKAAIPEGENYPRLNVAMGHVPGVIHVPRGEIGATTVSPEEKTYIFRGRMEDFPQPGPIAFGNSGFQGMIVMIDFLDADGKELRYPDRQYAQLPQKQTKTKIPKKEAEKEAKKEEKQTPQSPPFGQRLEIMVTSVEFQAPFYSSWPPPSHQQLLFPSENSDDESRYVRELLQRFMSRAYRRPVSEEEIEQTAQLFETIRPQADSFEHAMRETFASVLISPHFLYIVETHDQKDDDPRVTNFELASRLSYFLWSTQPDRRLLELATQGKLRKPATLRKEVLRLIEDGRSDEFAGRCIDQWLDLDGLERVAVNPEYFPEFDNELKDHMRRETHAYFAKILREDRNCLELLDSDWAMLNRPLAKHYELSGPRSSEFEQVMLNSNKRRGGLLTQGAFLLANSNGEDSHPIKRAVWILDRLLDSPPSPPPPDVPALDPENPDFANLPLKEQLALHRQKESCAQCHQGIDPWGIPLEHLDAVGRWRSEVPAHRERPTMTIDDSSELPNGTKIDGLRALQRYLVEERSAWFARSVVKRLMAYGLGRSLDFGDREAIESLTERFIANDYRLQPLIVDFIQSETFQTK
jgi:hypothetical protein